MEEVVIKFKVHKKEKQKFFDHLNDMVFNETNENQIIGEWEDVSLYYTEE